MANVWLVNPIRSDEKTILQMTTELVKARAAWDANSIKGVISKYSWKLTPESSQIVSNMSSDLVSWSWESQMVEAYSKLWISSWNVSWLHKYYQSAQKVYWNTPEIPEKDSNQNIKDIKGAAEFLSPIPAIYGLKKWISAIRSEIPLNSIQKQNTVNWVKKLVWNKTEQPQVIEKKAKEFIDMISWMPKNVVSAIKKKGARWLFDYTVWQLRGANQWIKEVMSTYWNVEVPAEKITQSLLDLAWNTKLKSDQNALKKVAKDISNYFTTNVKWEKVISVKNMQELKTKAYESQTFWTKLWATAKDAREASAWKTLGKVLKPAIEWATEGKIKPLNEVFSKAQELITNLWKITNEEEMQRVYSKLWQLEEYWKILLAKLPLVSPRRFTGLSQWAKTNKQIIKMIGRISKRWNSIKWVMWEATDSPLVKAWIEAVWKFAKNPLVKKWTEKVWKARKILNKWVKLANPELDAIMIAEMFNKKSAAEKTAIASGHPEAYKMMLQWIRDMKKKK